MAKQSAITAIVKYPQKNAEIVTIENTLASYQKLVGGYIECVSFPRIPSVDIIVNEEGKLVDKPVPNLLLPDYMDVCVGTIVIVGVDEDEGEFIGLTTDQIKAVKSFIKKYAL